MEIKPLDDDDDGGGSSSDGDRPLLPLLLSISKNMKRGESGSGEAGAKVVNNYVAAAAAAPANSDYYLEKVVSFCSGQGEILLLLSEAKLR